ncbi:MAG TPA: alpha-ketoglutarate-dependent dioxygenase AlkB [Anaerovoracaceae bacterium]|nr:alpha-ketoglutarate-dependent dioxygenase AlkB [Anaerovoracaceae bacterium]
MNGLTYLPLFISEQEEIELVQDIFESPWSLDLKRRTQHYGYKYDYTKKRIGQDLYLGPIPKWLEVITARVADIGNYDRIPDQVIVNEYLPGQGIAPHIDCQPCFGETVSSLSLLSSVRMNFYKRDDPYAEDQSIMLEPKSLLILTGEARNAWTHSIDRLRYDIINSTTVERSRRISLTFRTVNSSHIV